MLVLALDEVCLSLDLGEIGDEVVGVSALKASLLLSTMPSVLAVVMEPLQLVDDQCKLIIAKHLKLLLCDGSKDDEAKQLGEG